MSKEKYNLNTLNSLLIITFVILCLKANSQVFPLGFMTSSSVQAGSEYVNNATTTGLTDIWDAENLNVSKYNDGTSITKVTSAAEWVAARDAGVGCWAYYNFNDTNDGLGKYYNDKAVEDTAHGGLVPSGWRIANANDWEQLIEDLGGYINIYSKLVESGDNLNNFSAKQEALSFRNDVFYTTGGPYWWASSTKVYRVKNSSDLVTQSSNDSFMCNIRLVKN
jgi:uncharacterized protein (TIGR02145 family)